MPCDVGFGDLKVGDRFIHRKSYSSFILEDEILEISPSGEYFKLKTGWVSLKTLVSHNVLIEVLGGEVLGGEAEDMCPNCVTPWKCNGPHQPAPCRGAPGGSPDLEEYMRSLGL